MTHFSAWAFAWAICLVAAWAFAWAIASAPERPGTPVVPIRLELVGQRRASWDRQERPEARELCTLPLCSGLRQPIPVHLLARTIIPKAPIIHGRAHLVRVSEAAPQPQPQPQPQPVAVTARVVPLWVARREEQQQAERRRALEAASAGRPDPGYTYPGAHALAS